MLFSSRYSSRARQRAAVLFFAFSITHLHQVPANAHEEAASAETIRNPHHHLDGLLPCLSFLFRCKGLNSLASFDCLWKLSVSGERFSHSRYTTRINLVSSRIFVLRDCRGIPAFPILEHHVALSQAPFPEARSLSARPRRSLCGFGTGSETKRCVFREALADVGGVRYYEERGDRTL
ncbi:hypothetical protein OF83DRAFT_820823 [Amylostereum chailletii]|nr:hypothetical protein OF83DRAFT_820823 [Amylostereum chailletii]